MRRRRRVTGVYPQGNAPAIARTRRRLRPTLRRMSETDKHVATADARVRLQAMRELAQAVARPHHEGLASELVCTLARALDASAALLCVFDDTAPHALRPQVACVDGVLRELDVAAIDDSVCRPLCSGGFRYLGAGAPTAVCARAVLGAGELDALAALPLLDSGGISLGVLMVLHHRPVADGDALHVEAMMGLAGARLAAEIERRHNEAILRVVALAVSDARGGTVYDKLVRLLATTLRVESAFIARPHPQRETHMRILAQHLDGQLLHDIEYPRAGTPCEAAFGEGFEVHAEGVAERFPHDTHARAQGVQGYAVHRLAGQDGQALGIVAVWSRRPLQHVERIEAMLKIFAVRIAYEIEREQAGAALQRSEASYRAIFEAAESAVFVHDWDTGAIVDVNPKACETYGYTREEMLRLGVAEVSSGVPPYTAERAWSYMQLAKLGRCPPIEWHRRNKDGSLHWDEVRLKPAMIDGRPHIVAFTREITAYKEALAAAQAREEQYRAIFDGSADCLGLWDRNLRLVDVNQAFTRIRGLARHDVLARTLAERPDEPEYQQRLALIRAALDGQEGRIEVQMVHAAGGAMDVEIRYIPVDFGGERYALSVARDITERRARERALRASEARLRATVEAAFDGVIGMDGEGRIVEFNAAAERIFGHRRADVIGRRLGEAIIPPRHREAHERGLRHFHQSQRGPMVGRLVETIAMRADGSEFPVELAISVAAVPEGSIFVGHLRDISARRAAEAERAALEAQLRQAQKMEAIGQLTGGIAHDFNNILTSVIGYLVLGQERAEALGDAMLQRQLGQANLAAQRARDLIAQMLAFARRQRGERRALAVAPLVRQTLQLLRPTLPSSISVQTQGIDTADDAASPWVMADAVQLEQVLFNLCINARDAMGGHGRMGVSLGLLDDATPHCAACRAPVGQGPWVTLSVSDDGQGMAPAVLERVFDPFFSTKPPGQGSGMGLAMVHGIVHDHGGHVVVHTAPGEGARFTVLLPLADGSPGHPHKRATARMPTTRLDGHVLLVEDDTMVGDYLSELLAGWGLRVTLQRDPRLALRWLDEAGEPVDLLLTDQTMPGLTGLQLATELRTRRPGTPVVLVSGNAGGFDAHELQRAGVRAALPKPLQATALREQLQRLLAG